MNELLTSAILGFTFLVCFFIISLFTVVGVKFIIISIKKKFNSIFLPKVSEEVKAPPPKKRKRAKYKTISINPDEVDRVYFKKSS